MEAALQNSHRAEDIRGNLRGQCTSRLVSAPTSQKVSDFVLSDSYKDQSTLLQWAGLSNKHAGIMTFDEIAPLSGNNWGLWTQQIWSSVGCLCSVVHPSVLQPSGRVLTPYRTGTYISTPKGWTAYSWSDEWMRVNNLLKIITRRKRCSNWIWTWGLGLQFQKTTR